MRGFILAGFGVLVSLAGACAKGGDLDAGAGGGESASSSAKTTSTTTSGHSTSTTTSGSGTSTSGAAPTTCAEANGMVGCCQGTTAYYCKKDATTVTAEACTSGNTCGWKSGTGYDYYACVPMPGGADPSNANPIDCP
jgi:hypothetical protein